MGITEVSEDHKPIRNKHPDLTMMNDQNDASSDRTMHNIEEQSKPTKLSDQTSFLSLGPVGKLDHAFALFVSLFYLYWLMISSSEIGIPRDESIYFYAADRFIDWWTRLEELGWLSSLSRGEVDRGFAINHEHPMLMKELFGLSQYYLHQLLGWITDPILAYRFPTMLMASGLCYAVIVLGCSLAGVWAGAAAGLALIGMPRLFFHAHLACFDLPVTWMWFALSLAYLGALSKRRWIIGSGVILGLAFATKLNAFFAPFTLLLVTIIHLLQRRRGGHSLAPWVRRYSWLAASLILIGFTIFLIHWPWLYHDTWSRLMAYIQFHARHVHYPVDYLGHLYHGPPFPIHFPFVFTALTLPVATLGLGIVGLWRVGRLALQRWKEGSAEPPLEWFILCNCMIPFLIIAWPTTPIFGGTKHWMPAMPFFVLAVGIAFAQLTQKVTQSWRRGFQQTLKISCLVILMGPGLWLTSEYGAHGPAWYNHLAGGIPGAAELRMPRNFWGYSSVENLSWLNERPTERRQVFWHNATGLAVGMYHRAGWLDRRIRSTGDWTYPYADWALYHHQHEKLPEELDLWWAYDTPLPVEGYFIDGVQQIGVYSPRLTPTKE